MASLELYDMDDLGKALEKGDKAQCKKIMDSFMVMAQAQLSQTDPFLWSIVRNTDGHRYTSFEIPAPAAVMVTQDGFRNTTNLFLNPQQIWDMFKHYKHWATSFTALIVHEMGHLMYNHQARFQEICKNFPDDHELANIAEDSIINENPVIKNTELAHDGVTLKTLDEKFGTHYDGTKVSTLTWEGIYKTLLKKKKQAKNQNKSGQGQGQGSQNQSQGQGQGQGQGSSDPSARAEGKDLTKAPMATAGSAAGQKASHGLQRDMETTLKWPSDVPNKHHENPNVTNADIKNAIAQQIKAAMKESNQSIDDLKNRGDIPGDMVETLTIRATDKSVLKLSDLYKQGTGRLTRQRKKSHNQYRFNTSRFTYVNRTKRSRSQKIVAYIDTSGSMSNEVIEYALSQLVATVHTSGIPVTVKTFDTQIHPKDTRQIRSINDLTNISISGRGGTEVQSVFDDIKEEKYDGNSTLVVIMTDGYVEGAIDTHKFENVIWTLVDRDHAELPESFPGVVGYLKDDKEFEYHYLNDKAKETFGPGVDR